MSGGPVSPETYAARTAPLRPESRWTLEDGALVETCGRRRKVWPLVSLRRLRLVGEGNGGRRAAHLSFVDGRVMIPAQSLTSSLAFEDRSVGFDAFVARLQAAAVTTPSSVAAAAGPSQIANALVWGIGLTAAGAVFMIAASLVSGMVGLGLALGARLLFVAILLGAAVPWLGRDQRA